MAWSIWGVYRSLNSTISPSPSLMRSSTCSAVMVWLVRVISPLFGLLCGFFFKTIQKVFVLNADFRLQIINSQQIPIFFLCHFLLCLNCQDQKAILVAVLFDTCSRSVRIRPLDGFSIFGHIILRPTLVPIIELRQIVYSLNHLHELLNYKWTSPRAISFSPPASTS